MRSGRSRSCPSNPYRTAGSPPSRPLRQASEPAPASRGRRRPERPPEHPVVDIGGLVATVDRSGEGRCRRSDDAAMQAISEACKEWGFFQVVNHGVSCGVVERMRGVWRSFFRLPMEEKKMYTNSPKTYNGYGSRVGVDKGAVLDWGDYFFLTVLPESSQILDKWPKVPHNLREITEEYDHEMLKLCRVLTKAISAGLGLDENYIYRAFGGEDVEACVRANYYPKCPQPDLTVGLSPHSDPGGITVLLADDHVKGLQVRKGDEWVTVKPIPGAFVINVGDQVQVISNAKYKSVEHRALANAVERFSIAFFFNPNGRVPIGPAQELITPQSPPLYHPVTYNEYRLYVRKRGPHGKSQIDSLTTS
uniref:Fe2OG dioxygenase domain-containing protein n=1 Tax=Ananas comosus var. bracteatus TaxID=296719 RepID=A0A6V7NG26_ANACO|nr:unnamed protein product [Ananas comosus var. bracteatus]